MKWILKNKIVIAALVISFSFTLNADANFKKREDRVTGGANRAENAFTNSAPPSHSGPMRIDKPGGTEGGVPGGPSTEGPSPIGDAIPIVLSLSLIYGMYVLGKKRKEAK